MKSFQKDWIVWGKPLKICFKTLYGHNIWFIIHFIFFIYSIVRNKAAEKAKTSLCGSTSGTHSPSIVTQAGTGGTGGTGGVHSPGPMGQQAQGQQQPGQHHQQQPMVQQQQQQQLSMGIHGSDISALQRPSYSINGILGIPQPDANANINKRKRDDNGMYLLKSALQ